MYGVSLGIAALVLLTAVLTEALDCYTGRVGIGLVYTKCDRGIGYCVKRTINDPVYGPVTDKGCDIGTFCTAIGSRCQYNSYEDAELCCCNSNLCNSANSFYYLYSYSKTVLIVVSSFVLFNFLN